MLIGHFEPTLPTSELSSLFFCALITELVVKGKVEVKIEAAGDLLPYTRPYGIIVTSCAPLGSCRSPSSSSSDGRSHAGQTQVVFEVNETRLAVPNFRCIIVPSAEHVDGLVTTVAVHDAMLLAGYATQETRLVCFCFEQFVFDDHGRVKLGFLNLVADDVAVDDRATDDLA